MSPNNYKYIKVRLGLCMHSVATSLQAGFMYVAIASYTYHIIVRAYTLNQGWKWVTPVDPFDPLIHITIWMWPTYDPHVEVFFLKVAS